MNAISHPRGGAPVGHLRDLDAVEAGAVLYLRMWSDGEGSQESLNKAFEFALDRDTARLALRSLNQLMSICAVHGRRPMMRHDFTCTCVGADERCFANFVASAARGEREDAMLIASLMVRPDMAPCLVALAESVGLALTKMAMNPASIVQTGAEGCSIH